MTIGNLKKIRPGNMGFSLVELIIVIAIMAILIAVLAPMFVRYVERSRQTSDISAVGEMSSALKVAAMDTTIADSPPAVLSITWECGATGAITVSDPLYQESVELTLGSGVVPAVSFAARETNTAAITVTLNTTSGLVAAAATSGITDDDFLRLLNQIK